MKRRLIRIVGKFVLIPTAVTLASFAYLVSVLPDPEVSVEQQARVLLDLETGSGQLLASLPDKIERR